MDEAADNSGILTPLGLNISGLARFIC